MKAYTYKIPQNFDPKYLRAILNREFKGLLIGWLETKDTIRLDFNRELSDEELKKLNDLMAKPFPPLIVYKFQPLTAEDVEAVVGIKPLDIVFTRDGRVASVIFDRDLSEEEERKLAELVKNIPFRLRKR